MIRSKKEKEIISKRGRPSNGGCLARLVRFGVWFSLFSLLVAAVTIGGVYYFLSRDLPKISTLADYRPPLITTVYSDDNRKIAEFYRERRVLIPLEQMSPMLIQAFVAAEDSRFFKHQGVDILSIVRAFFKNIEAGSIVQGGSTITQQVTKSFFLSPEKSYVRKIKEAILAYRIDKSFSKKEILYLYLNQIYLGHGAYGVEAASENYFGKPAKELNLAECAMLAGLPQAPSRYSPFLFPERAKQRQIYVLNRMVDEQYITNIQATDAINTVLDIKPRKNWYIEEVPYFTEHVRRYLEEKYGSRALYEGGLQVYTTVNIEMQKTAREEIEKGLRDLDKRQGYRGPIRHLPLEQIESFAAELQGEHGSEPLEAGKIIKGVVIARDESGQTATVRLGKERGDLTLDDMRWARKPNPEIAYYEAGIKQVSDAIDVGDVIWVRLKGWDAQKNLWQLSLEQTPQVQSALLCLEAETGYVKAMVGGRDFKASQFNRAVQSRRQPGSAFKPIIYAAALDKGYTPATVIIDSPIVFQDEERDFTWKPKNYKERFYGPTLLREALAKSRNVVTIKILRDIGIDYAIEYARKLGIASELSHDLSIALGSSGVSLLELVKAYSVFANSGYLIEPVFVTKVLDRDGNVLEEADPSRQKVIEKSTAYIMTSLLESVVKEGTGHRARALKRPVAGKTGTTNNLHDAWFVGYTPRYITGCWVGFDEAQPLGKSETGSRAASPIWVAFMQRILADKPVRVFQVPEGVVFSKIDAETGLLPIALSKKTRFECFKEGTVPTEYTAQPDAISDTDQFFKSAM